MIGVKTLSILNKVKITIITLIILVVGVMIFYSLIPEDKYTESFAIDDASLQEQLVNELRNNQIEFTFDKHGQLWFNSKDSKKVHSLAFKIMGRKEN